MSSIIILLLNVICFKMFDKIAADAEIKRKNDIYKQSIDIYKREMEEREEHNEKLRRFRHDIKNHLIAIEKLALSKEYVRLRDYIHQLTDEKGVLQVTTISGNALIDGLLADKFDVARKYEIAVEYHIEIPTKLPFDDADLCIIVGNALDNAIDGTKDIEGAKKIEISMGVKQGNFLLKVKNTFNPELIKFDNNGNSFVIFIKCIWGYCKSMKILLISESSTEDDIYRMIDQIIKIDKIIETHDISEELSYITDIRYDIIIINYDKVRIRHGDFKMIFDIRCKTQAPLLVILEGCEIRDKLHVLNMKADDYIEKPINIDELEEKMLQLLHKLS